MTSALLDQIGNLTLKGTKCEDQATNFVLGFVDTMHPQDPVEAMLLTQMAATHQAAMMMTRRLNNADHIPQQDSAERALNKLLRTYTSQMEALRKYRNGGKGPRFLKIGARVLYDESVIEAYEEAQICQNTCGPISGEGA